MKVNCKNRGLCGHVVSFSKAWADSEPLDQNQNLKDLKRLEAQQGLTFESWILEFGVWEGFHTQNGIDLRVLCAWLLRGVNVLHVIVDEGWCCCGWVLSCMDADVGGC